MEIFEHEDSDQIDSADLGEVGDPSTLDVFIYSITRVAQKTECAAVYRVLTELQVVHRR
jgi:hypothetical protein